MRVSVDADGILIKITKPCDDIMLYLVRAINSIHYPTQGKNMRHQEIRMFIRKADLTPCGILIAYKEDNLVRFGYSSCDSEDLFSKPKGLEKAYERSEDSKFNNGSYKFTVPAHVMNDFVVFAARARKYFKLDNEIVINTNYTPCKDQMYVVK